MSLLVESYLRSLGLILDKGDIESDSYTNALSIQTTIKKLYENHKLSKFDLSVLEKVSIGYGYAEIANLLEVDRKKVAESFRRSCRKVAFILGGDFTNDGFMEKYSDYISQDEE